jgi:hypothetical protein
VVAAQLAELPTLAIDDPVAYDRLKDRVRVLVAARVPPGPTVVVSKGDEELLALHDRRGEHFPQDEAGRFTSAHPADGVEAVEQLQAFVARGARQLADPRDVVLVVRALRRADRMAGGAGHAERLRGRHGGGVRPRPGPGRRARRSPRARAGRPARAVAGLARPGWWLDEPRVLYCATTTRSSGPPVPRTTRSRSTARWRVRGRTSRGSWLGLVRPWLRRAKPGTPVVTEVPGHPDELLLHTDVGDWDDCSGRCATAGLYTGVLRSC